MTGHANGVADDVLSDAPDPVGVEDVEDVDVLVVGAGQAGLATSCMLARAGIAHQVLERDQVGASWAGRWDSFCLVTPNHTITLPDQGAYRGPEPHGYLRREEIVDHLQAYAASFAAPVRTGVTVRSLRTGHDGTLHLRTEDRVLRTRAVVAATGTFAHPHCPAALASLPAGFPVLEAGQYRSPHLLPEGPVLVVGSGQTGCQIAEELTLAGREVTLACGRAPWVPRRIDGRDIVDWLLEIGFLDGTVADLPSPAARLVANFQNTGANGGHDLSYRTLHALGVSLAGRLAGFDDGQVRFAADLVNSVAFGDARYREVRDLIAATCSSTGRSVPAMPDPPPFTESGPASRPLDAFGSVVITSGYRPAYHEWIEDARAFDAQGFPLQRDGASMVLPGLYFVGVHFLRTRRSSLLCGVGQDAALVATRIAAEFSR